VQVHAWMDRDELTLELRARTRADVSRHSMMLFGAHTITRYEGPLLQYQVIVSVVRPANHPQSVGALERLAGDVRLLASW
jgi:hypothetical protein